MSKAIMTGDEAVARGAYEAGCTVAAAYPGTPSTEILENLAQYEGVNSRWTSNEKIAFELAAGAAIGGAWALAAMKHVGLNVAADPLFTMGYAGVNGGLVVISADDPGCHSSQNEQDNRFYAPHAKLGLIEPSDSQECKDYMIAAFEISEKFDIPVLFRMTTRVCHSKSLVELGERQEGMLKPYVRDPGKYAMLPGTARARHAIREKLLVEMEEYANVSPLNRVEWGDRKIGIITSGISYQYAREVFGEGASYLKLGLTHPLPTKLIADFCAKVGAVYIIEEGDPYLENKVRAMGIACVGKEKIPVLGELNTSIVRKAFSGEEDVAAYEIATAAPPRPPVLCAGCPHRGYFYGILKNKKDIVVLGDIGCYSLGVNPPYEGFDTTICMGAGISATIGMAEALKLHGDKRKAFGMVGDSTFFHSGITGLVDAVHENSNICICILDNSITAMTGHQENAGTVKNLRGEPATQMDILKFVRATGLDESRIRVVDPIDIKAMDEAIKAAIRTEGPFVIVTKSPCVLIKQVARARAGKYYRINQSNCKKCKSCVRLACPAISFKDNVVTIDASACTACGLCIQVCKFNAIEKVGE